MTISRQRLTAGLLMALTLAIGWFAYSPALGGAFLLDDLSNLGDLRLVQDRISALSFIFSGEAGPLGRPLALATFVPQAAAWGQDPESFLRVNVLIHLANGCVLAWVLYRLSQLRGVREPDALVAAVAAAAIWLLMPLLASASLMIVQRMTTLSSFFMLLGLAGYVHARESIDRNAVRALVGMSISLVAGTLLAIFTKESGALLPIFVLVIESTLLTRPTSIDRTRWRAWFAGFLLLPALFILVYVIGRLPYSSELVLRRDFTGWERLLTEARILWEYLFHAFLPRPGQFGPFHDGYPVTRSIMDPLTFVALSAWLIVPTLAVLWRRRFPLFSFAALWFLGGHLLESTVIPLELYFEHRNYLPVVGPVYALCMLGAQVQGSRRRLVYAAVSAYVLINAFVLVGQASLWGNPPIAAAYWQRHFPNSVRAATTAIGHQLAQYGPQHGVQALHQFVEDNPTAGYLKIQELNLSCIISPEADHRTTVSELRGLLRNVDFTYTAGTMLSDLTTTVTRVDCNDVDGDIVGQLAAALADNPRYKNDIGYQQLHQQLLARLSRQAGDFAQTIRHLENAIELKPSSDLNMMMVTTYADAKDFNRARTYIEEARRRRPSNPLRDIVWQNELDELSLYIDELERHATSEPASH